MANETNIETDTTLVEKIIKQIEYYFGNINMAKDKFMQEEIQKDSGWVALDVLTTFNRLKVLSTDVKVIINALKQSKSDLLEIDEENNKIRRAIPLPENLSEFETSLKQNTVYAKGFPVTTSLDDLYAFFEPFGKVLQIFMRRFPTTKQFKGSVFVTFETNEQMKSFMALEEVKSQDVVLIRETQEDYLKRKGPGLETAKAAKQKRDQEKDDKKKQREEAEQAFYKSQVVLGSVIHLKGMPSQGTRENLKELFDTYAKIKWVDYNKGEPEAYVRFVEENKAKLALDGALKDGELKLLEKKLEYRILEGEEEQEFWKDTIKKLVDSKNNKKGARKNNHRGGSGGNKKDYRGKNKNKRSLNDDGDDNNENGSDGDDNNDAESNVKKQKV